MSNVLIGIIGVILFIGLALAGALFLGTQFSSASNTSKAAAVVQELQQISNAYASNTINSGTPIASDQGGSIVSLLVTSRDLKTAPGIPFAGATAPEGYDNIGQRNPAKPMGTVALTLGAAADKQARDVCYAIEKQMGAANPSASVDTVSYYDVKVTTDRRVGCLQNFYSGGYAAYVVL